MKNETQVYLINLICEKDHILEIFKYLFEYKSLNCYKNENADIEIIRAFCETVELNDDSYFIKGVTVESSDILGYVTSNKVSPGKRPFETIKNKGL